MTITSDPWNEPDTQRWLAHVEAELTPKIRESAFTMQLAPGDNPDAKIAVELGMSILLDKPLMLLVMPGRPIPERLRRCADMIVDFDFDRDEPGILHERINEFMTRFCKDEG